MKLANFNVQITPIDDLMGMIQIFTKPSKRQAMCVGANKNIAEQEG